MALTNADLIPILDSILVKEKSLISHHIDSFNQFIDNGIKSIMTNTFRIVTEYNNERDATPEDKSIDKYIMEAKILDVKITNPNTLSFDTQKKHVLFPCEAHRKDLTYSSSIYVNVEISLKAFKKDGTMIERKEELKEHRIGSIPIMVGSKLCNTHNLSREALLNLKEDPTDLGGYFIIRSNEWIIDNIESMTYNFLREFKNVGFKNELARSDIISKPGDNFENSSNLVCKFLNNGNIMFEITNNRFKNIQIPFFVLFRAFGVCDDKSVVEHIVYGLDVQHEVKDPILQKMLIILEKAFQSKYASLADAYSAHTQTETLELIGKFINDYYVTDNTTASKNLINIRKYNISSVLTILDKDILPHVGLTPDDRYNKVRFLGHLIRRLLLVHLEVLPSTDRDSYKNKRVNPAGVSYAKVFKTNFNFAIVQPVRRQFIKDLKSTSFSNINLGHSFETAIYGHEFEKALVHAIIIGDKTISINRKSVQNRLSSQQLHRKNEINVISALRNINTTNTSSAKQSERANEMRRVHSSTIGYVCCIQSADTGEKVGMQKQMAISARITLGSSSEKLKEIILEDDKLIPLNEKLTNIHIYVKKLTKVFVNGYWIGCVENYADFVGKYRQWRREGKIHYLTTITMDIRTNEIYFWVDIGRIVRPLIIVYRSEKGQYIKLTKDHINKLNAGAIGIDNLLDDQIIEFISPEEQQNCLISKDLETLEKHKMDITTQYTHLDIAQAIIGIPGLTSPFTNHNQPARGIFQTNQVKQTCGVPCMNFPYKTYKEMYLQVYNQKPLVKTLANKYIQPIGMNAVVAIQIYGGYNQDDSLMMNQGAVDRGLFTTHHFTFEKTELEKNEEFTNPDPAKTTDIKAYSNYGKLVNGMVPIGTLVEKGDIIIGKISKLNKTDQYGSYTHFDKSIVYKYEEPAYVWDVIKGRNEDDSVFCKIVFRSVRQVEIGNKFCLTSEHEVLTEKGWKFIEEVNTDEKIAIMSLDNNEISYEVPKVWNMFEVKDEDMYNINSPSVEITCTMNHKLPVKTQGSDNWKLMEVKDLLNVDYRVKKTGNLELRKDIETFVLEGFKHKNKNYSYINTEDKELNMDEWLFLLGIYLAEGHIDKKNTVRISAHKERVKTPLLECLKNLGFEYKNRDCEPNYVYITKNRALSQYFEPLGKGIYKYIPEFVWELNERQCRILYEAMMLGDGDKDGSRYSTGSSKLKDDFQRLLIHCGYSSYNKVSKKKGEVLKIKGAETTRGSDLNRIVISKDEKNQLLFKSKDIKITKFSGKVYCPTTSTHTFMIRKNGKVFWSGNSSRSG